MTLYVLSQEGLANFARNLIRDDTPVIGPVAKGDTFAFARLREPNELRLDYTVTELPLKKYLLPNGEIVMRFGNREGGCSFTRVVTDPEPVIFLGIHPDEVHALHALDEIMLRGTHVDPFYERLRRRNVIIALDFVAPPPHSFCAAMGTHTIESGFDLLLTNLGETYTVEVGTQEGQKLLSMFASYREATTEEIEMRVDVRHTVAAHYPQTLPLPVGCLPELYPVIADHPVWDELAGKCLNCQACTAVCPTCSCFTVEREVALDGSGGCSVRKCISCLSERFARVAGEHNFRKSLAHRIRHRICDNMIYWQMRGRRNGWAKCVGCGRCIKACEDKNNGDGIANPVPIIWMLYETMKRKEGVQ